MPKTDKEKLRELLDLPLWTSDCVFDWFRYELKTIFMEDRDNPQQQFIYIEGYRSKKVLLLAHANTFF